MTKTLDCVVQNVKGQYCSKNDTRCYYIDKDRVLKFLNTSTGVITEYYGCNFELYQRRFNMQL